MACGCGGIVTPIVNCYPNSIDVVAVVCISCRTVDRVQVLADKNASKASVDVIVH
jgi:hypothetical protein